MFRDLARLTRSEHDVLVIGGGITGLMAAYDAAQRGLSVALVERGDFGGATSSNHFRIVHGGLRYLQRGNLRRMRRSIVERRALARIALHLVAPLAFVAPVERRLARSRPAFALACGVDGWIGHDRNDGLPPALHLPPGRVLPMGECRQRWPDLAMPGVSHVAVWHDYQMPFAERLTFAVASAAQAHGAVLAHYVEALSPLRRNGRLGGAVARSVEDAGAPPFEIRARVTLNAAGPWAAAVLHAWGVSRPAPLLKALNLVTSRPASSPALVRTSPKGHALVLAPWGGRVFLGTGESAVTRGADDREVSRDEIGAFLDEANAAFPGMELRYDEITRVHRGVVPAVSAAGRSRLQERDELIDHRHDGVPGLLSAIAVKYTTARELAERAVDLVVRQLGRPARPCRTHVLPLPGAALRPGDLAADLMRKHGDWLADDVARSLAAAYGTGCDVVAGLASADSRLRARLSPEAPVLAAEISHAARHEGARTLVDAVARRTALGVARYPGDDAAHASADVLAAELGWAPDRTVREIARLRAFYAPVGSGSAR